MADQTSRLYDNVVKNNYLTEMQQKHTQEYSLQRNAQ